jgi:hypothetical protein
MPVDALLLKFANASRINRDAFFGTRALAWIKSFSSVVSSFSIVAISQEHHETWY